MQPPRVLSIAGSDSGGGAGIQADIKTITVLGGYAMTAICALTAQDTTGVHAVLPVDPAMVAAQIDACVNDIGVDAVKIGMLGSPEIAAVVADRLEKLAIPIVFDPVMISTSGAALADAATIAAFERLMAIATLTTPNVPELQALGGDTAMRARGVTYIAKGGDAEGPDVIDRLIVPGEPDRAWTAPRIVTRHTHGTGCTLSSAIASHLALGATLPEAVSRARVFIRRALRAGAPVRTGAGGGPLDHGHSPASMRLLPLADA